MLPNLINALDEISGFLRLGTMVIYGRLMKKEMVTPFILCSVKCALFFPEALLDELRIKVHPVDSLSSQNIKILQYMP